MKIVYTFLISVLLAGCSVHRQYEVMVTATPKGSKISVNGIYVGNAPLGHEDVMTFHFRQLNKFITVEASSEGYVAEKKKIILKRNDKGMVFPVHFDLSKK